jgi:hypothetical protein
MILIVWSVLAACACFICASRWRLRGAAISVVGGILVPCLLWLLLSLAALIAHGAQSSDFLFTFWAGAEMVVGMFGGTWLVIGIVAAAIALALRRGSNDHTSAAN